jgi:hypothetical protein
MTLKWAEEILNQVRNRKFRNSKIPLFLKGDQGGVLTLTANLEQSKFNQTFLLKDKP